MSEIIRKAHFDDAIALFFLLSMTGHDIIHDYGTGSSPIRWKQNIKLIKDFHPKEAWTGGKLRTNETTQAGIITTEQNNKSSAEEIKQFKDTANTSDKNTDNITINVKEDKNDTKETTAKQNQWNTPKQQNTPDPITQTTSETNDSAKTTNSTDLPQRTALFEHIDSEQNDTTETTMSPENMSDKFIAYHNAIDYWNQLITTKILLCFFYKYLRSGSKTVEPTQVETFLIPSDYSVNKRAFTKTAKIKKFVKNFKTIGGDGKRKRSRSNSRSRSKSNKKKQRRENMNPIGSIIKTIITEFVDLFKQTVTEPMNYEEFLEKLTQYMSQPVLNQLIDTNFRNQTSVMKGGSVEEIEKYKGLYETLETTIKESVGLLSESYLTDAPNIYTEKRKNTIKAILDIVKDNQVEETKGITENKLNGIIPKPRGFARPSRTTTDLFQSDERKKTLLKLLNPINEKIKTLEKKQRQEEEDKYKLEQNDLTSADKKVQSDFTEFVARSSLYLNRICDKDGNIENTDIARNIYLKLQASILIKQANWEKIENNKKYIIENITKNLDDDLINFFDVITNRKVINKEFDNFKTPTPIGTSVTNIHKNGVCGINYQNHVSNNAATALPDRAKKKLVCSTSALLDGMPTCNYNQDPNHPTQQSWERGNMNFMLTNHNENFFYQGKLNLSDKNEKEVVLKLKVNTPSGIELGRQNETSVDDESLKAYVALRKTLVGLLDYVTNHRDAFDLKGNIFRQLFEKATTEKVTTDPPGIFQIFYNEILYKGVGDLFQEINSAVKFGGYTFNNFDSFKQNKNNMTFNNRGDATRYFVANDRPSGVRFIMMVTQGKDGEINSGAIGGYFGDKKKLIVERAGRTPCVTDDWSRTAIRKRSMEPIETLRSTKRQRRGGGKKSQVRKTRKQKYKHRI